MNISSINSISYNYPKNYNSDKKLYGTNHSTLNSNQLSFKQSAQIPQEIIRYLKQINKKHLIYYDMHKLEGIQKGIKIFEGLNFPQIGYLYEKFGGIALQSGCDNGCIYCYADANSPSGRNKIDFEDYENFCNGFKELNKRLGFSGFYHTFLENPESQSLFYNSDSSKIYLQDKDGGMHDYADLSKMMHDVTENLVLFDTAGWGIKDKITQKRMDDLVKKVAESDDYNFIQFYISINPFHSIYNRSVEFLEKGDKENAEKFRKIYVDRMANVLYTMSPLLSKRNFCEENQLKFIARCLPNRLYIRGYGVNDLLYLFKDILKKLEQLYDADLASKNKKIVHDIGWKNEYLNQCSKLFRIDETLALSNKKLIDKLEKNDALDDYWRKEINSHLHNNPKEGRHFRNGYIHSDGILYMTNGYETYPTNIVVNINKKEVSKSDLAPNLRDKMIMID